MEASSGNWELNLALFQADTAELQWLWLETIVRNFE
jgi:hypothetical protein